MLLMLPTDNLNIIFNQLNLKDKNNLSICNKELNNYYGKDNIFKYRIEYYLNNDYINFYNFLNKYIYDDDYLNYLAIKSIKNIPSIYRSRCGGYYDMRFVYEIMYFGIILEDNLVQKLNKNFYIFFYKNLKECLVKKNKNKKKIIQLLKNNFKFFEKNIISKTYVKLLYDIEFYN